MSRPRRKWAVAVRCIAVPVWYPFAILAWLGEKADTAFWWIERQLPDVEKPPPGGWVKTIPRVAPPEEQPR